MRQIQICEVGPRDGLQNAKHLMPTEAKKAWIKAIAAAEQKLGKNGRILVRKSGTEPLIRVMAEGDDSELVRTVVDQIIEAIPRQAA